ncbi:tyrosine-type recombinase/integrase [Streptomyces sp. R35]|uniref:Tyrosine-type recombinase/integrase n=1 Tax=Streptomyces sp. R35 TaxID=3238630 RepID=A0AB39RXG0_9ACTN
MTATPGRERVPASAPVEPDWPYLAQHGVDRAVWELHFPFGASWHTLRPCAHPSCDRASAHSPWLCFTCHAAWKAAGSPVDVRAWCATAPAPSPARQYRQVPCRVGCLRPAEASGLCKTCARTRAYAGLTVEEYLATNPPPRPTLGECVVRVCSRWAHLRRTRLCPAHQRRWAKEGRPDLGAWARDAPAVYTTLGTVPLSDLDPFLRTQVLVGYEVQLRNGGRISPSQVKSAVLWLVAHAVGDLLQADLPPKGQTTTYVRTWRQYVELRSADRAAEHTRAVVRLNVLDPRFRGGTVDFSDVHAPWLLHLGQERVLQLAASGASGARLMLVGYTVRWFAMFLRTLPGEGRRPAAVGRAGMTGYLRWLAERARDTGRYESLPRDDPARTVIAERLLQSLVSGKGPLLVTPPRYYELLHTLREILDQGRSWLAGNGAGDVHLLAQDVPPYPERDDSESELEGRSQDALPEAVFLQLMAEDSLALLTPGTPRNYVELALRVGRRPWEIRHLEFDCVQWHDIDVEALDGSVQRRRYPFLVYWMQKVRRRHKLPLHPSDVTVITRQQEHLRQDFPQWFDADGRPLSPRMALFPTIRLSRANRLGERPYDSSSVGYWLGVWMAALTVLVDEHDNDFDRSRVFPYSFRHTYAQLRADAGVPLEILQVLMAHQDPSTTQMYYRVSHPRRVEAVRAIATKYQFDIAGGRLRRRSGDEDLADRARAGVGSVPVPGGSCHEMNNVRADGRGCPVYYRCFSCKFFTTDFSQLPELRQLRDTKAQQLALLEAAYGTVRRADHQVRNGPRVARRRREGDGRVLDAQPRPVRHGHSRRGGAGRPPVSGPADHRPDPPHQAGTVTARPPQAPPGTASKPIRKNTLDAGRLAAAARRRADSQACRRRVLDIIAGMRTTRIPLSDAEITRRAAVNPQYLQRHRDLKAEAEVVRAHLADHRPRVEAAAQARKEAALEVENRMLLEQNKALRRDLETARSELRAIRTRDLAAAAHGDLAALPHRDAEVEALCNERDQALATVRRCEADLAAQRNITQRLMTDNTRLLESTGHSSQPRKRADPSP